MGLGASKPHVTRVECRTNSFTLQVNKEGPMYKSEIDAYHTMMMNCARRQHDALAQAWDDGAI